MESEAIIKAEFNVILPIARHWSDNDGASMKFPLLGLFVPENANLNTIRC